MDRQTQRGFTLWELFVTLAVAGVVLGIGVPNLLEFTRNNAMASASNEFVTAVLAARAEAVKRGVPITLCATSDPLANPPTCVPSGAGTDGAFFVWVDENGNTDANGVPILSDASDGNAAVDTGETVIRRIEAPGTSIDVFMDNGYISYAPSGFARSVTGLGNPLSRLLYCDDRGSDTAAGGLSAARIVRVHPTGRADVHREVAQVNAGITDLTNSGVTVTCP